MKRSIPDELATLVLGESALLRGVRVVRCSLFGFRIGAAGEVLDAPSAAARLAAGEKVGTARVAVCFRCAGDGLGRRDRGVCGVCHGRGVTGASAA